MRWTTSEFISRGVSLDDLHLALTALRDTLRERLPADSADLAVQPIERAIEVLTGPQADDGANEPVGRSALSYLRAILEGQPREAIEQVLAAVSDEAAAKKAYLEVLIPAQRETGRMWQTGTLSIAEEHVITSTTRRAMALLCERGRSSAAKDKTVLLACVAGNVHDIGILAISDFHEMAGWRAINLGPDVPHEEIARGVTFFNANLVVLAATLDPHLKEVQRVIERIKAIEDCNVKVIVGGTVFERVPDLWKKVGADGFAARIEDAEPLGSRLVI